ncbi:MAG: hypothetical protein A4E57_03896 [Syntrophorhabdaceae bacterium PtaU1.Bin034]|nr:MAG: hypothetical protein A4E57_03896 [Syntrophorhabdaceae bacterium PtaU1.Bin034]
MFLRLLCPHLVQERFFSFPELRFPLLKLDMAVDKKGNIDLAEPLLERVEDPEPPRLFFGLLQALCHLAVDVLYPFQVRFYLFHAEKGIFLFLLKSGDAARLLDDNPPLVRFHLGEILDVALFDYGV